MIVLGFVSVHVRSQIAEDTMKVCVSGDKLSRSQQIMLIGAGWGGPGTFKSKGEPTGGITDLIRPENTFGVPEDEMKDVATERDIWSALSAFQADPDRGLGCVNGWVL